MPRPNCSGIYFADARRGQDFALGGSATPKFVGHDHPRDIVQAAAQRAEGPGRPTHPCPGHHAPRILLLAVNANKCLIKVPLVARLGPAPLHLVRELPVEAQSPCADGLVADHDAACGQDQLDVTQAEAKLMIELHRVLNRLGREPKTAVGRGRRHASMLPRTDQARQPYDSGSRRRVTQPTPWPGQERKRPSRPLQISSASVEVSIGVEHGRHSETR